MLSSAGCICIRFEQIWSPAVIQSAFFIYLNFREKHFYCISKASNSKNSHSNSILGLGDEWVTPAALFYAQCFINLKISGIWYKYRIQNIAWLYSK